MSLYERGWKDGFWGRDPTESDEVYLDAWEHGLRDGDRTRGALAPATPAAAPNGDSGTAVGDSLEGE